MTCKHKWRTTLGLFETYIDCELCGMKWEDVEQEKSTENEQLEILEELIKEYEYYTPSIWND